MRVAITTLVLRTTSLEIAQVMETVKGRMVLDERWALGLRRGRFG
jgi:hypothetical protein